MKLAVVIASRNRPDFLLRCIEQVKSTADVDVLTYVDDDQRDQYWFLDSMEGVKPTYGERVGPNRSLNRLVEKHSDYDAYQMFTDDMLVHSRGWDKLVEREWKRVHGGPVAMTPAHTYGNHFDIPCLSRAWIDALGYMCLPALYLSFWHVGIYALGEAVGRLVFFGKDQMYVTHQSQRREQISYDMEPEDAKQFCKWMSYGFSDDIERLRAAIDDRIPVIGRRTHDFKTWGEVDYRGVER